MYRLKDILNYHGTSNMHKYIILHVSKIHVKAQIIHNMHNRKVCFAHPSVPLCLMLINAQELFIVN